MSKHNASEGGPNTLARGLSILRCFDRPRVELTVSEIARRTKLSQPTAWRLCKTLVDEGFLVRTAQAHLRIGAPALTLGFAAIQGLDFPEIVQPYLRRVAEETRATTTLSLCQNGEMISINRCDGDIVAPNQPVGWRAPLSQVSSGLAVLASMNAAQRVAALAIEGAPVEDHARSARIDTAVSQLRSTGYVRYAGMVDGRFVAVAVPLVQPATPDPIYWAISCGGIAAMWDDDRLAMAGERLAALVPILEPALAAVAPSPAF